MGPNGSGKSTLSHALMGRGDYEVTAGSVTIDGEELLGLPDLAARAARAVPRDAVPGRGAGRPARGPRRASLRARAASTRRRLARSRRRRGRARSACRAELLARGVNDEFSGGEKKRAETVQLAVLEPEVRDPRRDRLRPRRRRAARRRPPGRAHDERDEPRRARDHALRAAAHRAAARPGARAPRRPHRASAVAPSSPTGSRRRATRASRPSVGVDELTVEMPREADPFSDPTVAVEPVRRSARLRRTAPERHQVGLDRGPDVVEPFRTRRQRGDDGGALSRRWRRGSTRPGAPSRIAS